MPRAGVNMLGHPAMAPAARNTGPGETFDCAALCLGPKPAWSSPPRNDFHRMDAFLVSTGIVALAEMGDKTQLLAMVLAARWGRPWTICAGVLLATLINHLLAALLGLGVAIVLSPDVLRWVVSASFVAMAAWLLVPDRLDPEAARPRNGLGVFCTTFALFFVAEMGDKTQIATVALTARYADVAGVVTGTTLGMMIANTPPIFMGGALASKLPMAAMRVSAALIFAMLGVLAWFNIGRFF